MQNCPKCWATRILPSRTRSTWESWRRRITGKRPFRCHLCGWRGWGDDFKAYFGDETPAGEIEGGDARPFSVGRSRRGFSAADLSRLDGEDQTEPQ